MPWFDAVDSPEDWRWRLGERDLQVHLGAGVLEISHCRAEERPDALIGGRQAPFETLERVSAPGAGALRLRPRHADRPVVGRPEVPLTILPGLSLRVYINVPAWLSLEVAGVSVWEVPSVTPSDTFFGSPVDGTLAYAMRTHLRTDPSGFKPSAHRVRVPVLLQNQGQDPLPIQRVRVPVQGLGIYAAADGTLWSPEVRFTRSEAPDAALVEVSASPPEQALPTPITGPRELGGDGPKVLRAFNSFFSGSN